ncbi:MAG: DUF1743 domain-containing protein [Thermoplasmata archaeon]|nr:DUF1743 domain-containing protein [Thermoplasmata archaeon]
MLLGIDDTDSPTGGCTTHALTEVLRAVQRAGADIVGWPRLVRLNPNVPWKTRGNAALAARVGRGVGRRRTAGHLPEGPLKVFERGTPLPASLRGRVIDAAWDAVQRHSERARNTDPALVAVDGPLPAALYQAAVHRVVTIDEVQAWLKAGRATVRVRGSERGLVGAAAAVAWPARRSTFELIAYRPPHRSDAPREVDGASVRATARRHPELFLCDDPATRRLMVVPHTRCPVLFGLRATGSAVLRTALAEVRSEPVERWVVFRTNQATGDHRHRTFAGALTPYAAGSIAGTVRAAPRVRRGGHVEFSIADRRGTDLDCIVFEPTKTLPKVVQSLVAGDAVRVWGGRADDPVFRVEGIELLRLRDRNQRLPLPRCPSCGGRIGSLGRDGGFRCRSCRWKNRVLQRPVGRISPTYREGVYHPTPSARRHLAPLPAAGDDPPPRLR